METWREESHYLGQNLSDSRAFRAEIINIIIMIKALHFQNRTSKRSAIKQATCLLPFSSGLIPAREGPEGRRGKDAVVARASNASRNKEEKTIIRKL